MLLWLFCAEGLAATHIGRRGTVGEISQHGAGPRRTGGSATLHSSFGFRMHATLPLYLKYSLSF